MSACPGRRRTQAGFVITIELLLLITILVIGSLVGLVAIRDALIKHMAAKTSHEITVYDATGVALGRALGFDEHQAPLVPYVDRTVPPLAPDPAHRNYRALIGVRDDRFTSREPVYYSGPDCTGTPCIKATSDEDADNTGLSGRPATGAVSYLHALQGGPNYAIGASPDGIQGHLYRSTALACPIAPVDIQSRYLSQKVVAGSPCETRGAPAEPAAGGFCSDPLIPCDVNLPETCACVTQPLVAPVDCSTGVSQQSILAGLEAEIVAQANSYLTVLNGLTDPSGNYTRFLGEIVITSIAGMDICCPAGAELLTSGAVETAGYLTLTEALLGAGLPSGQLTFLKTDLGAQAPTSEFSCVTEATSTDPGGGTGTSASADWGSLQTLAAEPVSHPDDPLRNALDGFVAPFQVSLPHDLAAESWISTPPDGEGSALP